MMTKRTGFWVAVAVIAAVALFDARGVILTNTPMGHLTQIVDLGTTTTVWQLPTGSHIEVGGDRLTRSTEVAATAAGLASTTRVTALETQTTTWNTVTAKAGTGSVTALEAQTTTWNTVTSKATTSSVSALENQTTTWNTVTEKASSASVTALSNLVLSSTIADIMDLAIDTPRTNAGRRAAVSASVRLDAGAGMAAAAWDVVEVATTTRYGWVSLESGTALVQVVAWVPSNAVFWVTNLSGSGSTTVSNGTFRRVEY